MDSRTQREDEACASTGGAATASIALRPRHKPGAALWLAAALTLAATGPVHALGMDLDYSHFRTADAVTWVRLCGSWGTDHLGTYRVVHAEKFAQSFVYVQWMQRGDAEDGYALKAVRTAAIAELDNDHADVSLTDLDCRATPRGIVVTARADSGHDEKLRRVTIEAGPAPGQYRLRMQRTR